MTEKNLVVYIVSDAIGQSAVNIARSALSQFPDLDYEVKDYTFISDFDEIDAIVLELKKEKTIQSFSILFQIQIWPNI